MTSRKPYGAHTLEDWDDNGTVVGVVRDRDENPERFQDLASQVMKWAGTDPTEWEPEPPQWSWWRMNPDWSHYYSWLLTPADGPGPGNWRGALVRLQPKRDAADQ